MRCTYLLTSLALVGCSPSPSVEGPATESSTTTGDDEGTSAADDDTTGGAPGSSSTVSSGEDAGGSTTTGASEIGTLIETGTATIEAPTSSPPRCDDLCGDLGGWCEDSNAGRQYYDCGSDSHGGRYYSCTYPPEAEYYDDIDGEWCTLVELSCECHGVPVDPTVEVLATEGLYSCDDVCGSWDLECGDGGYAYDEFDATLPNLDCETIPHADVRRYVCLCTEA